jgi:simple sugar transport system ATP-binding protein
MSLPVATEGRGADRPPSVRDLPPIAAVNISKRFGPTIALKDVSFEVAAHECHALVGRNGAGKSTMVGILTGLREADTGAVRLGGEPAPSLANREAWRQKVACVYQHSTVIPALSVAENLFIDRQPSRYGMIDWRGMRLEARRLLDQWGVNVNVDRLAGDLTVGTRQLVEIARALSHGARLIILDEPTAQLDGDEIARLFRHMQELQKDGVTFLFISHHLQEVYDICQTVTVLRDARHIITAAVSELPKDRLIECMTGEAAALPMVAAGAKRSSDDKPMLALIDLSGDGYDDVSFAIQRGEIVGITGATSSGRIAIAEAIAGLSRPTGGQVLVDGSRLAIGDVPAALAQGVACVPQDRHRQGLVLGQSIADNVTMTIGERLGPAGFISPRAKTKVAREAIGSLGIVTGGADQAVVELSGGNQQKVVVGRALASNPKVIVLIDPTAGVDIKAKAQIHAIVDRERRAGKAIVLSSSEIEDLRICDRVLVMFRGKLTREFPAGWRDGDLISAIEGIGHHERG